MAILTEEQIKEIDTMRFRFNEHHFKYELEKWNENQQSSTLFEPNWKILPSKIKFCHLRHCYFDDIGNEVDWKFIISYERPATPHPHAEMMVKYAEVATQRVDPWMEFERYNYLTGSWDRLDDHPSWRPNAIYHYIGDTK